MKKQGRLENQLHVLRAEKRWSQKDVAEMLNVSRQTILSIEANRYNPSLILAFEIADLFGKDIGEVFRYVKDEQEGE
ncbi:helix-turn-helix transcriptional regulator [Paenibacillus sp. P26]|nr:helix-turn-helix transcriptional regulator [Paenibacillus sp. P26]UUZ94712.1 helix-turn-helix transcriptional regulator [Paenibacillus sp. P25]